MPGYNIAEVYDLVFRERKDYPSEVAEFTDTIRSRKPDSSSLLDVACGTGEHLSYLSRDFSAVEGLELAPSMCDVARTKLPGTPVHCADMRSFDLGKRFDAVLCTFSSIAHVESVEELEDAVACMARHLTSGGVLLVEPWVMPENFSKAQPISQASVNGQVGHHVVERDGRTVASVSHFSSEGRKAHIDIHYLLGDSTGVSHFPDALDFMFFSRAEYERAFVQAGCDVAFREDGPSERGMFIGVRH